VDTQLLFLEDSYAQEAQAKIIEILPEGAVFDKTIFFYTSGGQPCDTGTIIKKAGGEKGSIIKENAGDEKNNAGAGGKEYFVKEVRKKDGKIIHFIEGAHDLQEGDEIFEKIDWEKRYKLMRMHTAAHVLASIMFKQGKIMITGNQLGEEKTRFDFNMQNYDTQFMQKCIGDANEALSQGHKVKTYSLPREEAMKIEGVVKLAGALPPSLTRLRIVEIGEIDVQADGGTHVKNTREVGKIIFEKGENKGKENRRIYFKLEK